MCQSQKISPPSAPSLRRCESRLSVLPRLTWSRCEEVLTTPRDKRLENSAATYGAARTYPAPTCQTLMMKSQTSGWEWAARSGHAPRVVQPDAKHPDDNPAAVVASASGDPRLIELRRELLERRQVGH